MCRCRRDRCDRSTASFHYGYYFHGPAGLGVRLPEPQSQPHSVQAPEFIVHLVSAFPGQFTVIALGPLTNIARALAIEPRLAGWIREIVVMGGAVEAPGNVTPHAEFNIYNDPQAAAIVLSSGVPVTLVGLDVLRPDRGYERRPALGAGQLKDGEAREQDSRQLVQAAARSRQL